MPGDGAAGAVRSADMATITLDVPDALLHDLRARLDAEGRGPLEAYLSDVVRDLADDDVDSTDDLPDSVDGQGEVGEPLTPELERLMLEGLDSPLQDMTGQDWDDFRRIVANRRAAAGFPSDAPVATPSRAARATAAAR